MPPRKKAIAGPPALTDDDVADLRSRVAEGEKPRVVVRTASAAVPAGTRGNVVRIGNPSEGEYIVVRLGRDQVPFAPAELALTSRSRQPAPPPPAPRRAAKPDAAKRSTRRERPSREPAKREPAQREPSRRETAKREPAPKARRTTKTTAATARTPRRATSKRRSSQTLTVTLRFTDDVWTVEAQRGARRIAKPSVVRPGAVKTFAELVDDADVGAAMSETVASSRAVVEERAQKLRAELQAAEATLRDYDARRH